jgi:hypothetical protein
MKRTFRTAVLALLLGVAAMGAVHAGERVQHAAQPADEVVLRVETPAGEQARPQPRRAEQLDGELRADMSEHLDPRTIALIAIAIGVAGVVAGVRRHRALEESPGTV